MAESIVDQVEFEIQPTRQELKALANIILIGFKAFKSAKYPLCYKQFLEAINNIDYWACEAINLVADQRELYPIQIDDAHRWISYTKCNKSMSRLSNEINRVLKLLD